MKNNFLLRCFFIFIFSLAASFTFSKKDLIAIPQFGINPGNLNLNYYLPETKDTSTAKKPLLVVLHGCNQTAQSMADLCGWNKLADENNFIVLYPEQKMINNPSRCFNWFNLDDIEKGKGECESIREMIVYLKKRENIDSTRIFIAGLSAGAAMTVVMLATQPELFKAGTSFAGAAYKTATSASDALRAMSQQVHKTPEEWAHLVHQQNPEYKGSYPKLVIYQGLNDKVVNPLNAENLRQQWIGLLDKDSTTRSWEESGLNGLTEIKLEIYFSGRNGKNRPYLYCYLVNNLGHKILINPGQNRNQCGKKGAFSKEIGYNAPYRALVDMGLIPFSE